MFGDNRMGFVVNIFGRRRNSKKAIKKSERDTPVRKSVRDRKDKLAKSGNGLISDTGEAGRSNT